jgi:outer membrane protein TolC
MRAPPLRATFLCLLFAVPAVAENASPLPKYSLRQLVEMAQSTYPGVEAARHALSAMEQDLFRAQWAWIPQGKVKGLLAPAPELHCLAADGKTRDPVNCIQTTTLNINSFDIAGVMARVELELGMPLYTFGKLGSAKHAASAGVDIKKAQLQTSQDKLAIDVTKAYWGLKLAREILYTIHEGRTYLVEAEEKIEKDLEEGEGEYTVTDLLRLKTAKAEVDMRLPEAQKLEKLTLNVLATLIGQPLGRFDVDTQVLDVLPGAPLPVQSYLTLAQGHRPELKLLEAAVRARQAAVDLERARFFPDFLLVGMVTYAKTTSVDDPSNAFYSDPFNTFGAGFGLAMTWSLDQVLQYGSWQKAKAEVSETAAQRAEAQRGISLEINKAVVELNEARDRLDAAKKGETYARRWLVAISQNLATGLSETRDLTDALLGFFQMRLKNLQAMYDVNVAWSELGRVIGTVAVKK